MAAERARKGTEPDAGRGLLQAALDQVIDAVWSSLRCARASIMLADGEGEKALLGLAAWRGELDEEALHARVGSGMSTSGRVHAGARAQRVADVDTAGPEVTTRGEGGSFICMPLPLDGRVLGVINVRRPRGDEPFSASDERLLEALALFAARRYRSRSSPTCSIPVLPSERWKANAPFRCRRWTPCRRDRLSRHRWRNCWRSPFTRK
jgi:L-methionine (R)-S-oxide reductase